MFFFFKHYPHNPHFKDILSLLFLFWTNITVWLTNCDKLWIFILKQVVLKKKHFDPCFFSTVFFFFKKKNMFKKKNRTRFFFKKTLKRTSEWMRMWMKKVCKFLSGALFCWIAGVPPVVAMLCGQLELGPAISKRRHRRRVWRV